MAGPPESTPSQHLPRNPGQVTLKANSRFLARCSESCRAHPGNADESAPPRRRPLRSLRGNRSSGRSSHHTVTINLLYPSREEAVSHKLVMTRQVRDWLHALRSGIRSRAGSSPRPSTGCSTTARRSAVRWRIGFPAPGCTTSKNCAQAPAAPPRCGSCSSSTRHAMRCCWSRVTSPAGGTSGTGMRSRRPRRRTRHI